MKLINCLKISYVNEIGQVIRTHLNILMQIKHFAPTFINEMENSTFLNSVFFKLKHQHNQQAFSNGTFHFKKNGMNLTDLRIVGAPSSSEIFAHLVRMC